MRRPSVALALVALIAAATPAPAAAGLWDDFKAKLLDSTKWVGDQFGTPPPGVIALELVRQVKGGKLLMSHRAAGESGGVSTNRLTFRNTAPFTSIQYDVKVNSVSTIDCGAPPFSVANISQFNFLFRTDDAGLGCGTVPCDVFAVFYMDHVTPDGAGMVQVHATVEARPTDGSPGTLIGGVQEFGVAKKNQKLVVKITWDAASQKVVFDVKDKTVVTTREVVYGPLNAVANDGPLNTIEVSEFVCAGGSAESSASWDNIVVTP